MRLCAATRARTLHAVDDPREVMERQERALNDHDLDALTDCFDKHLHSADIGHAGHTVEGREQLRRNWALMLAEVPDLRAELRGTAVEDDTVGGPNGASTERDATEASSTCAALRSPRFRVAASSRVGGTSLRSTLGTRQPASTSGAFSTPSRAKSCQADLPIETTELRGGRPRSTVAARTGSRADTQAVRAERKPRRGRNDGVRTALQQDAQKTCAKSSSASGSAPIPTPSRASTTTGRGGQEDGEQHDPRIRLPEQQPRRVNRSRPDGALPRGGPIGRLRPWRARLVDSRPDLRCSRSHGCTSVTRGQRRLPPQEGAG